MDCIKEDSQSTFTKLGTYSAISAARFRYASPEREREKLGSPYTYPALRLIQVLPGHPHSMSTLLLRSMCLKTRFMKEDKLAYTCTDMHTNA